MCMKPYAWLSEPGRSLVIEAKNKPRGNGKSFLCIPKNCKVKLHDSVHQRVDLAKMTGFNKSLKRTSHVKIVMAKTGPSLYEVAEVKSIPEGAHFICLVDPTS